MENASKPPAPSTAERDPSPPEPPRRLDGRPRAAPKEPITRGSIVDAALRVLDREGMDGLSMRSVGEELGTGAASLYYWHVRNKGELLQLLVERITQEVRLPEPDPSRWQEQLKELGRQTRAVLARHPDSARISLGRIPAGPTIALRSEWLFELLRPVGIPDRVIAYLGDMMGLYVGAYASEGMFSGDADERFEFGMNVIIRGIETFATKS